MGLHLVGLERALSSGKTDEAKKVLGSLEQAVESALMDVQESITGLRASRGPDRSLIGSLRDYLAHFGEQTGLRTEFKVEGTEEPAIPTLAQVQVLRVVQEALTNVRKHARATKATIASRSHDGVTEIVVEDNGQGFDMARSPLDSRRHFGLQTMRERTEEIGGTFEVDSAPGKGTRVRLQLRRA